MQPLSCERLKSSHNEMWPLCGFECCHPACRARGSATGSVTLVATLQIQLCCTASIQRWAACSAAHPAARRTGGCSAAGRGRSATPAADHRPPGGRSAPWAAPRARVSAGPRPGRMSGCTVIGSGSTPWPHVTCSCQNQPNRRHMNRHMMPPRARKLAPPLLVLRGASHE